MEPNKDIRFSEKKIDESWKEQVGAAKSSAPEAGSPKPETSKVFLSLVQSLGFQALMHLGAVPDPATQEVSADLDAARGTIDMLVALRDKTSGNLSAEEKKLLDGLLSELQIKYSQSV